MLLTVVLPCWHGCLQCVGKSLRAVFTIVFTLLRVVVGLVAKLILRRATGGQRPLAQIAHVVSSLTFWIQDMLSQRLFT